MLCAHHSPAMWSVVLCKRTGMCFARYLVMAACPPSQLICRRRRRQHHRHRRGSSDASVKTWLKTLFHDGGHPSDPVSHRANQLRSSSSVSRSASGCDSYRRLTSAECFAPRWLSIRAVCPCALTCEVACPEEVCELTNRHSHASAGSTLTRRRPSTTAAAGGRPAQTWPMPWRA